MKITLEKDNVIYFRRSKGSNSKALPDNAIKRLDSILEFCENDNFHYGENLNFSHLLELGATKEKSGILLQKVGFPEKWIPCCNDELPVFRKGNILQYKDTLKFAYAERYRHDYVVVRTENGIKREKCDSFNLDYKKIYQDYRIFCTGIQNSCFHRNVKYDKIREVFDLLPKKEKNNYSLLLSPEYLSLSVGIDWPKNMGFKEGTVKPLNFLNKRFVRMGFLGGKNISTKMHSFYELSLPYVENVSLMTKGTMDNHNFKTKIDKIYNKDLDGLNSVLKEQGLSEISQTDFDKILIDYKDYLRTIFKLGFDKKFPHLNLV